MAGSTFQANSFDLQQHEQNNNVIDLSEGTGLFVSFHICASSTSLSATERLMRRVDEVMGAA